MNYLAHIFLSGNDRCIQIGNFIGDGVKGDGYKQYPRKFQQGILLHREIDAFSDRHPLVREARRDRPGNFRALFGCSERHLVRLFPGQPVSGLCRSSPSNGSAEGFIPP